MCYTVGMNITLKELHKMLEGTGFRVAYPDSLSMLCLYDDDAPVGQQMMMLSPSLECIFERVLQLCDLVRKSDWLSPVT